MTNKKFEMYSYFIKPTNILYGNKLTIIYCISGSFTIIINEIAYNVQKGQFVVINPSDHYQVVRSQKAFGHCFSIDAAIIEDALDTEFFFILIDPYQGNEVIGKIKNLLNKMIYLDMQKRKNDLQLTSLFYQLTDIIVSNFTVKFEGKSLEKDVRVLKIRNYIQHNYKNKIELTDLADSLYMSKGYLSRFFKKKFGCGFLTYLNDVRLYQVVSQLVNTRDPIVDIALNNGFNSISGFNRLFKNKFKMTPREYRKEKQNETVNKELATDISKKFLSEEKTEVTSFREDGTENSKIIDIDILQREKNLLRKNWQQLINLGDANSLLKSQNQKNSEKVLKLLKFRYARIWGIFDVINFREDLYTNQVNYNDLNTILDAILDTRTKPFIVIGPRSKAIPNKVEKQEDIIQYYINDKLWNKLLNDFLNYLTKRYGKEEVESWYFEIWNPNEFESTYSPNYLDSWYLKWLRSTLKIFKNKKTNFKVGGCSFILSQSKEMAQVTFNKIMEVFDDVGIKPSFISIMCYPYIGNEVSTKSDQLQSEISEARNLFSRYYNIPLFVTEWNSDVSNRQPLNDTTYKGSYIIRTVLNDLAEPELIGYSMALDSYTDSYDSAWLLNGASGLISSTGLKKPAFFAFEFLSYLDDIVLYRDKDIILTGDDNGNYTILLSNLQPLNNLFFIESQEVNYSNYDQFFMDSKESNYVIRLNGVNTTEYVIRERSIDSGHGNLLKTWKELGYAKHIDREDYQYIESIDIPSLSANKITVKDTLKLKGFLPANSFKIITIKKVNR